MQSANRGFTLIELMTVVSIIAILAAIAYPAYQDQVRKSRRAQAKADLIEYAQLAERHFSVNNSYSDFVSPSDQSPREGGTAYYTVAFESDSASTFTITATATEQGGQNNDRCGDLSISSTGQKTRSGSAELSECW